MTDLIMRRFDGEARDWNRLIEGLPRPHLLQTWEWAHVKANFGWQPIPLVWERADSSKNDSSNGPERSKFVAAAMLLRRDILSRGFAQRLCVLYVPKGPLMDWAGADLRRAVLGDLEEFARGQGAVLLKIDPDVEVGRGYLDSTGGEEVEAKRILAELKERRWVFSGDQVQFRNTVILDLTPSEPEILGGMKQKTRYNIRLAERKGIHVRTGGPAEIPLLYRMYAETSERDGFVIRKPEYYRKVWETFLRTPERQGQPFAEALVAEFDGEPVAAILVFYFGGRAYYLYGMSRAAHREKMPNYILQWEAIRRAKEHGCTHYDLWGAPDTIDEQDPMSGVYRFKEGLGGEVVRTIGAWDYPASALWYAVYTRLVPRLLDIMRARGRRHVRETLGGA